MGGVGKTLRRALGTTGAELMGASVFEFAGRATGIDPVKIDESKFAPTADEASFTRQLSEIAAGRGETAAQLQQKLGLQKATAQSQAFAASQRGINPGLAARLAAQNLGQTQQEVMNQSALNRLRENEAARSLLGQMFASQRGSRIQGAQAQFEAEEAAAGRAGKFLQGVGQAAAAGAGGAPGGAAAAAGKPPGMAYGGVAIDSPQNDVVPAMLSPGEIVVPKSVAQMGPQASAQFVQALQRFVK